VEDCDDFETVASQSVGNHIRCARHYCLLDRAKKAAAILCKGGVSFQFRAHDLRRTAASYMGEAGVDRFHIAHVLNHRSVTHSTVTAIYDRYRYDTEKRAALEKWAEVLFGIVDVNRRQRERLPDAQHVRTCTSSGLRQGSVPWQLCTEIQGCGFTRYA
jgi:hypothetical protein